MSENALIRMENIGYLIYSLPKCCYLVPKKEAVEIIDRIVENKEYHRGIFDGVDQSLIRELKDIGIDENVRVLDNRNKTDRQIFAPLEYYFDFTNKCNLRCEHCYNKNHLGQRTMPQKDVSAIINEMYDLGVMRLHLAGGEPTIEKEGIKNYISTAKKNHIVTSMATNGTLLSEEMCNILLDNDMFAISVSIDGYNEETNGFRRGCGIFNKSVEGVKTLVKLKKEKNKKTEICIKPIYTYETPYQFFDKMTEFAISLNVDKIKFSNPERSVNHELQFYGKHIDEYYERLKYITTIQEKYKDQIKVMNVSNPIVGCFNIGLQGIHGCIGGQELLTINPDGRITPCLMNDTKLGSYYDYDSITDFLLNSEKLTTYLNSICNESCEGCEAYGMCRGGCQVRKRVEYGKIEKKDPYCPKAYNSNTIKAPLTMDYQLFDFVCVSHSL